jgi:TRAP-type mannitol/chloroaromatic compound transport system substrate-binding protein
MRWRLTSSFPKSLDVIHGGAEIFANALAEGTDNKFQVQVFPPGELAPAREAADAVSSGAAEICHTSSSYSIAKDPAFALAAGVPFGLNQRMQSAWMYEGGGIDLLNAFFAKHNLYALPAGNTGAQMGGWFKKELASPQDFTGLKIAVAGLAARVLEKLGAKPQAIEPTDLSSSLTKGSVDAAAYLGPHDDEKLGLYKLAQFYYYPAFWGGQWMFHLFFNREKWELLPKTYQVAIRNAAHVTHSTMIARYDMLQKPAIVRLVTAGTQLKPFGEAILDAALKASNEVVADLSSKHADFKKIHDAMREVRRDSYLWLQVSESTYDTYMMIQQRKRTL